MQRTTSALTAAVLGAALTASTAVAQQAPPPGDPQPTGASSANTSPTTAAEAADSQVYGMSVTRGARYLLRNGLDYLSYQQYDRALKFLREAEARINDQKARINDPKTRTDKRGRKIPLELNAAELTALQQGIEAAQRGLRRASNAEAPYALSDRSRPGNGFTPAMPSTRLASRDYRTNTSARKPKTTTSSTSSMLGSDGDEEQGQPVRLASAEIAAQNQPAGPNPTMQSGTNNQELAPGVADTEGPANTPEVPSIPIVSRLPDLTAVNGTRPSVITHAQNAAKSQLIAQTGQVMPELNATVPPQAQPLKETPTPVSVPSALPAGIAGGPKPAANQESSSSAPEPLDISPLPAPANEAAAKQAAQDQAPGLPMSDGTATASSSPLITRVSPTSPAVTSPDSGLAKSAAVAPSTEAIKEKTTIDPETMPSSAIDQAVAQPVNAGGALHQEYSDPVPASSPGSASVTPTPTSNPTAEPLVAPPTANEDLPPLPSDLGRPATEARATDAPKAQPPTAVAPVTPPTADESLPPLPANLGRSASTADESLPPLPANLGRSVLSASENATITAPSTRVDEAPVAVPSAPTIPEQAAATQPTDRSTAAQSADGVIAQPTNDGLPVLPGGSVQPPAANSIEPAVPTASSAASELLPAANPVAPIAAPEAVTTEPSQLPDSGVDSSPTTTTAIAPTSPAMNTSLEPLPAAALPARSESRPETSDLPPALTGETPASGTGILIPERRSSPSSLKPELQREVERIARRQEEAMQRQTQNPTQPTTSAPRDTMASDLRTQTQMDISRAPSPAEARPIKAIPVPEDWVPLEPRNWTPQRKYWAAAATCHLPLYFQDPVLERYGHSVEQFVGPLSRFLTYPVDDPTQSTQRNQMLQPFFSAGLMGLQIIAWPYNLVMDPPWEAQYDLGYYRPGDNIPTDTYWLPLHGYGPPLRGSNY